MATPPPPAPPPPPPAPRRTAEQMATQQRQISVADFFSKNRHLLGFDNPRRALLTAVKEAVDNSLDACEEAGILPNVTVQLENFDANEEHFTLTVSDNGPGIVPKQIPNVFGRLLYGSKFHRRKQSRGQQGIGISAAGMYGLISTGRAMEIWSRTGAKALCYYCKLKIDMSKNQGVILTEKELKDWTEFEHGTRVSLSLEGKYIGGRQGIDEYLRQTAIANPHAEFHYRLPGKPEIVFPRAIETLPPEAKEIKPHPYGVELGILMKMLESTDCSTLSEFLRTEFSNISPALAREICEKTGNVTVRSRPKGISPKDAQALHQAIMNVKISRPRLDCLVPIGAEAILAGMKKEVKAEFYNSVTRPPQVYRGNPFQVEVGIAYGWPGGNAVTIGQPQPEEPPKRRRRSLLDEEEEENGQDEPIRLTRFANRVPLQYKQTDCALFKGVTRLNWRNYGLSQKRGQLPFGPMEIFIHMVSVWVPFTSESKEAIAEYDEIIKEIRLAVAECGRTLGVFLNRKNAAAREAERRRVFELYIEEVANSCHEILPAVNREKLKDQLVEIARSKTEVLLPGTDPDGGPDGAPPEGGPGNAPPEDGGGRGKGGGEAEADSEDGDEFALKPAPAGKPGRKAPPARVAKAASVKPTKGPPGKKNQPPAESRTSAKSGRLEQLSLKIQAAPEKRASGRHGAEAEPLLTLALPAGDLDDDLGDLDEPPPKKPKSA